MSSTEQFNAEAVPEHCPGPTGKEAGKASPCQGCPNQGACASGVAAKPDPAVEQIRDRLINVKHKVLVLSGKGGVGKSSVTAMLARTLSAEKNADGLSNEVAVVDVDICGPSLPRMFGVEGEDVHQSMDGWTPIQVDENLCVFSIGFLLGSPDDAIIWRGPRKNGMIRDFLQKVNWGSADWMLIDTPPGTSDEHLSLATYLSNATGVDGAIIVGTPQDVALLDVRKEVTFCRKVGLKVIGLIENMSGYQCPCCNTVSQIFRPTSGGVEALCKDMDVPFLGRIPLDPRLAAACDEGKNFVEDHPDSAVTVAYKDIMRKM